MGDWNATESCTIASKQEFVKILTNRQIDASENQTKRRIFNSQCRVSSLMSGQVAGKDGDRESGRFMRTDMPAFHRRNGSFLNRTNMVELGNKWIRAFAPDNRFKEEREATGDFASLFCGVSSRLTRNWHFVKSFPIDFTALRSISRLVHSYSTLRAANCNCLTIAVYYSRV